MTPAVYAYPQSDEGYVGRWSNGVMVCGHFTTTAKDDASRLKENGLKWRALFRTYTCGCPRLGSETPAYRYDISTQSCISSTPLLRDPYETRRCVCVRACMCVCVRVFDSLSISLSLSRRINYFLPQPLLYFKYFHSTRSYTLSHSHTQGLRQAGNRRRCGRGPLRPFGSSEGPGRVHVQRRA